MCITESASKDVSKLRNNMGVFTRVYEFKPPNNISSAVIEA